MPTRPSSSPSSWLPCGNILRGTDEFLQLVEEGIGTVFNDMVVFPGGGAVSSYFSNAFMVLWNGGMKDDFLNLAAKYPSYNLWVVLPL